MKRIEIMFSLSLEEDVLTLLAPIPEAKFYTIIPGVHGKGLTTPKMGDSVWPQENELMIIYCADEGAPKIEKAMAKIRKIYPDEGCACFVM